jgi:hypothetical protein
MSARRALRAGTGCVRGGACERRRRKAQPYERKQPLRRAARRSRREKQRRCVESRVIPPERSASANFSSYDVLRRARTALRRAPPAQTCTGPNAGQSLTLWARTEER